MDFLDISTEEYREYDLPDFYQPYRIKDPRRLYIGDTGHRVVDAYGITHYIPKVDRCVIRWKATPEVSF